MFDEPGSRDRTTEITYAMHLRSMIRACKSELQLPSPTVSQVISWFAVQDFRYSAATIRAYRAALTFAASAESDGAESGPMGIERDRKLLSEGPLPKPKNEQKRTSTKKVKRVPTGVVERLLVLLNDEKPARRWKINRTDLPPSMTESFSVAPEDAKVVRVSGRATRAQNLARQAAQRANAAFITPAKPKTPG